MTNSEYRRLAGRTNDEFKSDIKKAHSIEKEIIERFAIYNKNQYGIDIDIENNGVDNSGEFLELKDVRMDADFIVCGRKMEVKYLEGWRDFFRLKVINLRSYLKQKAYILLVNGWGTENPQFTLIKTKELKRILRYGKQYNFKKWENKRVVEIYADEYFWNNLPPL